MTPPADPFEGLLRQQQWLRELARTLVATPAHADDLVQETMLRAVQAPPRAVDDSGRRAWLRRVAANVARMLHRGDVRRRARELAVARAEAIDGVAESVQKVAAQRTLVDAVMALEPLDRDVVVLRYFDGLPPRRIAARLGLTGAAVRSRLQRALRVLRARLDGDPDDRRALHLLAASPLFGAATAPASLVLAMKKSFALLLAGVLALFALPWVVPVPGLEWLHEAPALPGVAAASGELASGRTPTEPTVAAGDDRTAVAIEPVALPAVAVGPALTFVVRLVDPDGRPVVGGTLAAKATLGPIFAERHRPELLQTPPPVPLEQRGEPADANGRTTLTLAWAASARPDLLTLVATAAGRAAHELDLEGTDLAGADPVYLGDVVLAAGGDCTGRVLLPDGAPAVGVEVRAMRLFDDGPIGRARTRVFGALWFQLGDGHRPRTTTDAEGRYRLDGVPAGTLTIAARGAATLTALSANFDVPAGGVLAVPDLRLELPTADVLVRGRVVGTADEPVVGAKVQLLSFDLQSAPGATTCATAADGSFALPAAPGDEYAVIVRDPTRGRLERRPVRAGDADLELRYEAPRWIEIVVHAQDGGEVGEVGIGMEGRDGRGLRAAREPLAPGRVRAAVPAAPFFVTAWTPLLRWARQGPFEPESAPQQLEFRLERANGIRGRVLADGIPVAGARVHAHADASPPRPAVGTFATRVDDGGTPREVVTDADGRFFVPMLGAASVWLHAECDGFARAEAGPIACAPDRDCECELTFGPGSAIAGRLLLAPGASPMGVRVAASRGDGHVQVTRAADDGSFGFAALTPGEWQVQRYDPATRSFPRGVRDAVAVTVLPGAVAACELDARDAGACQLRGTVTFDGQPARDWSVWTDGGEVAIDRLGQFALRLPNPGRHWLTLRPAQVGRVMALWRLPAEVALGDNVVDLARATGTIVVENLPPRAAGQGFDEPQFGLVWRGDGPARWTASIHAPDAEGRARIEQAPVGRIALVRRPERPRSMLPDLDWPEVAACDLLPGALQVLTLR